MSGEERRNFTHRALAMSLARFVRPGDTKLSRDQFLRLVIDRIVNELGALIEPSEKAS